MRQARPPSRATPNARLRAFAPRPRAGTRPAAQGCENGVFPGRQLSRALPATLCLDRCHRAIYEVRKACLLSCLRVPPESRQIVCPSPIELNRKPTATACKGAAHMGYQVPKGEEGNMSLPPTAILPALSLDGAIRVGQLGSCRRTGGRLCPPAIYGSRPCGDVPNPAWATQRADTSARSRTCLSIVFIGPPPFVGISRSSMPRAPLPGH